MVAAAVYAGALPCPCATQNRADAMRPPERRRPLPYPWEVANGCREPAMRPVAYLKGEPLRRCGAAVVTSEAPWAWDVLRLYPLWEQGTLPNSGGVLDQPAQLLDALQLVDAEVRGHRNQEQAPSPTGGTGERSGKGRTAASPVRSSLKPLRKRR